MSFLPLGSGLWSAAGLCFVVGGLLLLALDLLPEYRLSRLRRLIDSISVRLDALDGRIGETETDDDYEGPHADQARQKIWLDWATARGNIYSALEKLPGGALPKCLALIEDGGTIGDYRAALGELTAFVTAKQSKTAGSWRALIGLDIGLIALGFALFAWLGPPDF